MGRFPRENDPFDISGRHMMLQVGAQKMNYYGAGAQRKTGVLARQEALSEPVDDGRREPANRASSKAIPIYGESTDLQAMSDTSEDLLSNIPRAIQFFLSNRGKLRDPGRGRFLCVAFTLISDRA